MSKPNGWLLAATVSMVLAGCAGGNVKSGAGADGIYQQLDQVASNYAAALGADDGAGAEAADARLRTSLAQLDRLSSRCAHTAGCDMRKVTTTYAQLLQQTTGDNEEPATEGDDEVTSGGSLPASERTITLLRGHKLSDLIAMNGPVKSALEGWLTWRRPQLMQAYVNYEYLRHLMWPPFKAAKLPEAVLFGLVAQESAGKVHAVSRAGAKGPLQFMPATAARFGLGIVNGFDERFDPHKSAQAAAKYLDEQLDVFNDNLELVLGAYNGGEGRMRRLAGDKPSVSFYDPSIYFALPQQTRGYVPDVLAAAWLFLHPDSYHLTFPHINATPGHIKLARQASLSEITICLGQDAGMRNGWFRTLRNLNPRVNPQQELPAGTRLNVPKTAEAAYAADCTDGPWPILAADLHSGKVPEPPPSGLPRHYVVRRGDTLTGIVKKLGCSSVRGIARKNHLRYPHYPIRVGQTLVLPRCY